MNTSKVVLLLLFIIVSVSVLSCSSFKLDEILIKPDYERKIDKTVIIKPYIEAVEKDRVFVSFGVEEFSKKDEDSFYISLINSIINADIFKEVIITDSSKEAEQTKGNVYLRIHNNVASMSMDAKDRWYARFSTTLSFGVKNLLYFQKTYDITEGPSLSPVSIKNRVYEKILKAFIKDMEHIDLDTPLEE